MSSTPSTGLYQLTHAIATVKELMSKSYMRQFTDASCQVLHITEASKAKTGIRLLKIKQLVISDELIESRLTSIYQTLHQLVNSCFLIIQGKDHTLSLYLGFHSNAPGTAEKAFTQTLLGNFPGILIESLKADKIASVMQQMQSTPESGPMTVASVSVVPSSRSEQHSSESVQGMEKFMDTMQGKDFTAILIATPYPEEDIHKKIAALESIYTMLSPFERITIQDSQNITYTLSDSEATTLASSISQNVNQAFTLGSTDGTFRSRGHGGAFSISLLELGLSFSGQSVTGRQSANSQSSTKGSSSGTSSSTSTTKSHASSQAKGVSKTVIQAQTNKEIQNLLEKLQKQMVRLRESEAQGLWDCCGYFISHANDTTIVAANAFQGLVTGDATNIETSIINLWQPTLKEEAVSNHTAIANLTHCLSLGIAPVFYTNGTIKKTESIVTGKELSKMMCLPKKSAGDVSVIKMAAFGRDIHFINEKSANTDKASSFPIGKIMHMGREEEHLDVLLELQKLNAHTFAAGATGVGKTTLICNILQQLYLQHIPFTVIEPAKGEYGEIFGRLLDIDVYSTTPFRYRMLRLNPFAFHEHVHILDHMERLISVFSTAWPLYAAQPAILRDCVHIAYRNYGWDMKNSVCIKKERIFPTFLDVLHALPEAIKNSKFVGESRGTYEGALQTRLSMLSKGIFKELLCSDYSVDDEELFDKNVIIDLSRLGSPETLSLVMGILLTRLYEHRIQKGKKDTLTHVTVLEEAHNILKKSASVPQGEDVSSIASKSVEVLTKCIAELRFTGEGFLIADQSPGEVDATAIKNTATKLIMRLQGTEDQAAIAAALALEELQTSELSRLEKGVGLVFQEGWVEPVLAKFPKPDTRFSAKHYTELHAEVSYSDLCEVRYFLLKEILTQWEQSLYQIQKLEQQLSHIQSFSIWKLKDYHRLFQRYHTSYRKLKDSFASNRVKMPFFGKLIRELLDCADLLELIPVPIPDKDMSIPYSQDISYQKQCLAWREDIYEALEHYCYHLTAKEKEVLTTLLLLADGTAKKEQLLAAAVFQEQKKKEEQKYEL